MFQTHIANTISEYIDILQSIRKQASEIWFRGQSNAYFNLVPSALRNIYATHDSRGNPFPSPIKDYIGSFSNNECAFLPVDYMVEKFRERASKYIEYEATCEVEWECIAQHYGLPTRVLDWTTNAMYALYFAVCDCEIGVCTDKDIEFFLKYGISKGGGAVFAINPYEINSKTEFKDYFIDGSPQVFDAVVHNDIILSYLRNYMPPLCFYGPNKEKRISRQAGNFSTTGTLLWSMDGIDVLQPKIHKIFIPYSRFITIRKELEGMGITHETMYVCDDEKDSIAREIADRTNKEFLELMESNLIERQ